MEGKLIDTYYFSFRFIFLEEKDASTKLARIDSVKKDCAELHRQVDRHLRALNGSGVSPLYSMHNVR